MRHNINSRNDLMLTEQEELQEESTEENSFFTEYEITSSPNDFNVSTIVNQIDKGSFVIPHFQRNYVWDLGMASRLIESLILGLPIPQIFLYEQGRNKYLVIDGQQRLMSIYYFVNQRFPRMEKRNEVRRLFEKKGNISKDMLIDDELFTEFKLKLSSKLPEEKSKLNRLRYDSLGDWQNTLDFRTIRCILVKQNLPQSDDSSIFEIFNRLNTGGIKLAPQEIRASLYHSDFMKMIARLNTEEDWRHLLGTTEPDLRLQDIEVLLRGFALLKERENYRPSLTRFLNSFAKIMKDAEQNELELMENIFREFLRNCVNQKYDSGIFSRKGLLFETVFYVACIDGYKAKNTDVLQISSDRIKTLEDDEKFKSVSKIQTTTLKNVKERLERACEILQG